MTDERNTPTSSKVIITDLQMPFMSMVGFMVKWVLASIPAIIILAVIFAMISGVFTALILGGGKQ